MMTGVWFVVAVQAQGDKAKERRRRRKECL